MNDCKEALLLLRKIEQVEAKLMCPSLFFMLADETKKRRYVQRQCNFVCSGQMMVHIYLSGAGSTGDILQHT